MTILCDTCSIIMLIRIAPDMLIDEKYECVTLQDVRKEFFEKQKFKSRYPWRVNFKEKILPLKTTFIETETFKYYYSLFKNMVDTLNFMNSNKRNYSLSYVDIKIAACVITNNFNISTTDKDLMTFLYNEFDVINYSPLKIINQWLEKGLFIWNENLDGIIKEWSICQEAPQPREDIMKFEKLTGFKYSGT